jgi:NTP pyrophosphatase (non-canonical NTP hydrolase)
MGNHMFEMTFQHLAAINFARAIRWHKAGLESWSIADWAVAMAGEAGEVCNAVKKLRRILGQTANISDEDRQLNSEKEAIEKIGNEIADTVIYCDLLAQRCGLSLAEIIRAKFNKTSETYGFPERL